MEKRHVHIDDMTSLHLLQSPSFSPDGRSVVFVRKQAYEDSYVSHVFVQQLEETIAVQWTFGTGQASEPAFSPDGRFIAFSYKKDTDSRPQLALFSTAGGEPKILTDLPGGVSSINWSFDSSRIYFNTALAPGVHPDEEEKAEEREPLVVERLKYKSDAVGFITEKKKQLASVLLEDESVHVLTDDSFDLDLQDVSPDGTKLLYSANKEHDQRIGMDMYLYDIHQETHSKIMMGSFSQASFSPDGSLIAAAGHQLEFKGATQTEIWMYDTASGQAAAVTGSRDAGFADTMIADVQNSAGTAGPQWDQDSRSVLVPFTEHGSVNLSRVYADGTIEEITAGSNHVFTYAYHQAADRLIAGISWTDHPGELFIQQKHGWEQLTTFHDPFLAEVKLAPAEEIWVDTDDDWKAQAWVLPAAPEKDQGAALLHIHGGPHAMYGETFFHELQVLAASGFTVIYGNPRGSHGYGQAFVNAVRRDYGGRDYADLMHITDAALQRFPQIQEDRLGVLGGSYGGFMTNWITTRTNRFRAAATMRCISNWTSFYGVSDIGYFFTEWEVGEDFLSDPDFLWDHSPLKYVKQIQTPMLILHGEKDYRCPVEQAEQLFVSLKMQEKPVRFVRFPDANHELSRSGPPKLRAARIQELLEWFTTYLLQEEAESVSPE
ncbi:S9 family peptidase [Alkalicoccus chagannorensis]|uniref:S9 family peptidase n=1 Tax=Alkalicoccus chagannorensis TaxID=427072 RepID=UPI0003F50353|nr:S9 family peptidase [Alkalicoccus chagannorensis]